MEAFARQEGRTGPTVNTDSDGQAGKPSGGNKLSDRPYEDGSAEILKDLVIRLRDHSESLRRDIRRLQRALIEINKAIAFSLDRIERLKGSTDKLQEIFAVGIDHGVQAREEQRRAEQRSGKDRRSGLDRRRSRSEVRGLLRWIEGTSLDRRKIPDRRSTGDRRVKEQSVEASVPAGMALAVKRRAGGDVISLAAYRRSRKAARSKSRS
jgi:hypothetical protein